MGRGEGISWNREVVFALGPILATLEVTKDSKLRTSLVAKLLSQVKAARRRIITILACFSMFLVGILMVMV